MQNGKECNAYYATRSTALTKQLSEALHCSNGNRKKHTGGVEDLIQKTYQFRPACYKESQIDVLLVDEAHRVQEKSNDQTDGSLKKKCGVESVYCPLNQALSLIYCSKVTPRQSRNLQRTIKVSTLSRLKNLKQSTLIRQSLTPRKS